MKSTHIKLVERSEMRPVASGRKPNAVYRIREHLTEDEMDRLLAALKRNRYGHRDWLIGLLIYRHGLRVSEACDLRWDDINLAKRTIIVRRLKGSDDSTHYLERDELAGLKALQRGYKLNGIESPYVFVNERKRDARWPRLVAQETVITCLHEAFLPAPDTGLRLAGPAHDLIGTTPSAVNRTISARQTCLCGALRSRASAFSRRRSAGLRVMEIPVRMRQTRMHPLTWESLPGFKCQTQSTSCSGDFVSEAMLQLCHC